MKFRKKLAQRATNRNRVRQPNLRSAIARFQAAGERQAAQADFEIGRNAIEMKGELERLSYAFIITSAGGQNP
jgi:hypothetical protein